MANGIKKITDAMATAIPEENVARFERIAAAVERMQASNGFNLNIGRDAAANIANVQNTMELAQDSAERTVQSTIDVENGLEDVAPAASEAVDGVHNFSDAVRDAGNASKRSSGLIGKLIHAFGRILMYRAIRTAIKEITEGFKLGIANVREYSKAIGSEFYKAMDAANNATFKMKNSLGAALAPALQALIPVLQMVVSWVISAANAFNQFISLMTGATSWTRATDAAADSLDDVKKSAGGAGKAVQ